MTTLLMLTRHIAFLPPDGQARSNVVARAPKRPETLRRGPERSR